MNDMDYGLKEMNDTMTKTYDERFTDNVMMERECYEIDDRTER